MKTKTLGPRLGLLLGLLGLPTTGALAAPAPPAATHRGVEASAKPAADQGDAGSQSALGAMLSLGQGVKQEQAEAVKWLHLAALQGCARAQHNLGVHYVKGLGVYLRSRRPRGKRGPNTPWKSAAR